MDVSKEVTELKTSKEFTSCHARCVKPSCFSADQFTVFSWRCLHYFSMSFTYQHINYHRISLETKRNAFFDDRILNILNVFPYWIRKVFLISNSGFSLAFRYCVHTLCHIYSSICQYINLHIRRKKNQIKMSFILSMTKLGNKILPHHTSFYFSELFLLMSQVLILNPVLMKKVADHLPCYYTKYIYIEW